VHRGKGSGMVEKVWSVQDMKLQWDFRGFVIVNL
jgi:hypothetical protein